MTILFTWFVMFSMPCGETPNSVEKMADKISESCDITGVSAMVLASEVVKILYDVEMVLNDLADPGSDADTVEHAEDRIYSFFQSRKSVISVVRPDNSRIRYPLFIYVERLKGLAKMKNYSSVKITLDFDHMSLVGIDDVSRGDQISYQMIVSVPQLFSSTKTVDGAKVASYEDVTKKHFSLDVQNYGDEWVLIVTSVRAMESSRKIREYYEIRRWEHKGNKP